MRKRMLPIVLVLALVFSLAGCGGGDAGSDEVRSMSIQIAGTVPEDNPLSMAVSLFEETVEELSDGNMQVEFFPNGQLGSGREVVESVMLGNVQGAECSSSAFSSWTNELAILGLPYVFLNREIAHTFWASEMADQIRQNVCDSTGVRVAAFWENGNRMLSNSKREVKSLADMKGLKIRVMESDLYVKMFEAMGCLATPMSSTELYTALQQGTVDGQDNPFTNVLTYGYYDVQKYLTNTGHTFDATAFMFNDEWYQGLNDAERTIIDDAVAKATEFQLAKAAEMEEINLDILINEHNMIYSELTPEQKVEFQTATAPVIDWFIENSETKTDVAEVLKAVAEIQKELGY